jgi:hypothetical protein
VTELLSRASSRELTEWVAFASLEPFGVETDQLGHAITASTVANVNRSKGQKAYRVEDFMPKFEKRNQTPDEMIQLAEMFTVGMGGVDLRDKEDG